MISKAVVRSLAAMPRAFLDRLFTLAAAAIERKAGAFVTHHERPKTADAVRTWSEAAVDARTGIVIQGPIATAENFTAETVAIYRRHFPDALVIVSMWQTEPPAAVERLRQLGAVVVQSAPPANAGPSNVNFQLVSSSAGIREARGRGCEFVLKTRTDQRMYAPNALAFLLAMCRQFPLADAGEQRMRLIGCSLNTFRYRLYGVSDMFLFGHIDDMELYWNAPLDERGTNTAPAGNSVRDFCRWNVCEVYLMTHFVERVGHRIDWTLADSYRVYAERFAIVDREAIDLFWMKYSRRAEHRGMRYDGEFNNRLLSFRDWLLLYTNAIGASHDQERALDLAFGAEVPASV